MKKYMFYLLFALLTASRVYAQTTIEALDLKLEKIQQLGYLPGFAVAVVNAEGVVYANGFGFQNIERKRPFTTRTLLNIGSISKTITGICLMKLQEEGKLDIDAPINTYLPFRIDNPYHRDVPITLRHLATHTGTILDPEDYERTYLFKGKLRFHPDSIPSELQGYVGQYNSNVPMPLEAFIKGMMHPLGRRYDKRNFSRKKPGRHYAYSNMGAAIAGYIIERISGMSYEAYSKQAVLDVLGMRSSGWHYETIDQAAFASLYASNDAVIPPYSLISTADGGLVTCIDEMAGFLQLAIQGYLGTSEKLLSKTGFQDMMRPNFISRKKRAGFFWQINGKDEIGHFGGDPGIMTFMMFDPKTGYGRIIFSNKYDEGGNGYNQMAYIWMTLGRFISAQVEGASGK